MSKRQAMSYKTWLECQVALFHITRKSRPCRPLAIMKDPRYDIVPLHHRPDLLLHCCKLINTEWKRSETARLKSLKASCDMFPTCLILLHKEEVVGHCKISLMPGYSDCCVIESFIIDNAYRSQGFGSMLLRGVEAYVLKKGINVVYLMTKGQEGFYLKNDYTICDPINGLYRYSDTFTNSIPEEKQNSVNVPSIGPPPPPMPENIKSPTQIIIASRTFMMKKLEPDYYT